MYIKTVCRMGEKQFFDKKYFLIYLPERFYEVIFVGIFLFFYDCMEFMSFIIPPVLPIPIYFNRTHSCAMLLEFAYDFCIAHILCVIFYTVMHAVQNKKNRYSKKFFLQ